MLKPLTLALSCAFTSREILEGNILGLDGLVSCIFTVFDSMSIEDLMTTVSELVSLSSFEMVGTCAWNMRTWHGEQKNLGAGSLPVAIARCHEGMKEAIVTAERRCTSTAQEDPLASRSLFVA